MLRDYKCVNCGKQLTLEETKTHLNCGVNNTTEPWLDTTMRHNKQIDDACARGACANGQNLGHMPRIYHICTKLKPLIIVETGVGAEGHGSSTYTFLTIAKEMDGHLYSIDTDPRNEWFQPKFPELDFTRWTFIQKDSLQGLTEIPFEIDFLHLDSDHSYQHVTAELMATQDLMAPVHVIASHDTETLQPNCRRAMHEWAEKNGYTLKQYEDWHGLSLLTKNPELFDGLV